MLDGIDIRQLELSELRAQIALVSQEVYLFHGTIAENISYGLEKMDIQLVEAASRSAQMHDFVQSLPESYQTIVGERGIRLSGGQRQRLSIARAVLKNSPVLIFDEATSSLDNSTEKSVMDSIGYLSKNLTIIIVTHRLSTIEKCNKV